MLLFVGLGNPTPDSENNRHNVGFKVIDAINKKFNLSKQKPKFKGLLTTGNIEGEKIYADSYDSDAFTKVNNETGNRGYYHLEKVTNTQGTQANAKTKISQHNRRKRHNRP